MLTSVHGAAGERPVGRQSYAGRTSLLVAAALALSSCTSSAPAVENLIGADDDSVDSEHCVPYADTGVISATVGLDNSRGDRDLTVESVELQEQKALELTKAYIAPPEVWQRLMNGAPFRPSDEWVSQAIPPGADAVVPAGETWGLVQVVKASEEGGSAHQSVVHYKVEGTPHTAFTHTSITVAPEGRVCE
ncbi:hypothetical protein KIN34_15400 [Cellulomonas sp. DKR-3]|uniref:Lipoprotein n=1 Tax=Cellulomonas fulva TaxID=2835530 RepID=A0ABS5U2N6_9CELL|nr:hypothetical protein [Cellulomonas fulva]MBT0995665.1 hypothetical protein [Cellulomonas fulva]